MTGTAMTGSLSLGVALDVAPQQGGDYATGLAEFGHLARHADDLGFAVLSAGESYVFRSGDPMTFHAPNALMVLAAVAGQVKRIRLQAGVSLLAGWTPLRLAYDTALLDQLSGGRVVLGIGLGGPQAWRAFGAEPDSMAGRLRSTVAFLRSAWTGSIPGTENSELVPRPVQPCGPPILVGGSLPVSARRAARIGDGYIASSGYPLNLITAQAGRYRAHLAEIAPDIVPQVSVNRLTVVARTHEEALARYQAHAAPIVRAYAGSGAAGTRVADGQRSLCLVGTPQTVAEQLVAYRDAGVTSVQLRVRPRGTSVEQARESLDLVAEHVRPLLDQEVTP